MSTSKLRQWVNASPERAREYERESLIIEVCEEILAALQANQMTKAELASKLGTSKSHITQLLNGARNMTLRTLADIGFALNRKPRFKLAHKNEQVCWSGSDLGFEVVFRRPLAASITIEGSVEASNEENWIDTEVPVNAA